MGKKEKNNATAEEHRAVYLGRTEWIDEQYNWIKSSEGKRLDPQTARSLIKQINSLKSRIPIENRQALLELKPFAKKLEDNDYPEMAKLEEREQKLSEEFDQLANACEDQILDLQRFLER